MNKQRSVGQSDFDSAAASYDTIFTKSQIGMLQRQRVYHWLAKFNVLDESQKIYEINCGTGYDAEQFYQMGHEIVATDASQEMILSAKSTRSNQIDFYQKSFDEVATDNKLKESDFLFSNFGGLNCINCDELKNFITEIAKHQKKGNKLAFVIMPKRCWWEDLYFLIKGKWKQIGRRKERALVKVNENQVMTYYHSPKDLINILNPNYKTLKIRPIAFFIPPSYLEPFFARYQWFLQLLNNLEKLFGRLEVLSKWSDHFIIIAERK